MAAGKRVDFIVLDADPRRVAVAEIPAICVKGRYIDGVLRWERE